MIGVLGTDTVCRLIHQYETLYLSCGIALLTVSSYAANYHTFCPLAPKRLLATTDPRKAAVDEPFLLTVLLTIASKDEPAYKDIHQHCWKYLKRHLLDILLATPSTLRVGSVEGLLLLSEWVPYMQLETCSYPNMFPRNLSAVEDNMAWSLIGQAVRHSYLLRLDKASFRETAVGESQELENRNLLAWICASHEILLVVGDTDHLFQLYILPTDRSPSVWDNPSGLVGHRSRRTLRPMTFQLYGLGQMQNTNMHMCYRPPSSSRSFFTTCMTLYTRPRSEELKWFEEETTIAT